MYIHFLRDSKKSIFQLINFVTKHVFAYGVVHKKTKPIELASIFDCNNWLKTEWMTHYIIQ